MAVIKVAQSVANAEKGSAFYKLVVEYNALATAFNALTAKLDADAGVTDTDYASELGTMDTLSFRDTGTPA